MKKRQDLWLATIFSMVACIYLYQLPKNVFSESEERKALSSKADDGYFAARSFPDASISLRAYESALLEARLQLMEQNNLRGSFNNDWATQGPFDIGARINTIAVNPQNEDIIYLGFARGGIFKTTDGGKNWKPIFDNQPFLSIGDIELDPANPNTIYVGTGDPNIGYYSSIGDGIWKSTDAGATWTNIGLKNQRIISKVKVDPKNPNIIYAGAMGIPFMKNNERGLYKSIDGGKNWSQKLFISDSTGVCDFMLNPQNPNEIYASTWDRIRNNNQNIVSGEGAGVFKSIDGGNNWTKLGGGLPTGKFSRTGITMYEKDPRILYAVYVAAGTFNHHAIYKSTDSGLNWVALPDDFQENGLPKSALGGFGWYFAKIEVNPNDPNDIFLLGVDLWRTKNNGVNWEMGTPFWSSYEVHADKHDLVFTPSGKLLLATDGGAYKNDNVSSDWIDIENIAATQFYRVAYNPHEPNMYYGGAQDNGTTSGNAQSTAWDRIFGGDGFQTRFEKENPLAIFCESQNGAIYYSSENNNFNEVLEQEQYNDRRHWDGQYVVSEHSKYTIFYGTQRVWKGIYIPSNDSFKVNWTAISPDLTDDDGKPGATNTITTIEESSLEKDLLYVGTADANVWRLSPNTSNWVNISNGLPNRYITKVLPSSTNKNAVFVSVSGYREFEDTPHIWKSENQGSTWKNISGDMPQLAVNDLLVLENNKDSVIFAATDGGVYFTKNAGKNWLRLGGNMPIIPVFDIDYNPIKNQLIAGTFARSIMTFDLKNIGVDIKSIVKTIDNNSLAQNVNLFPTVFDNSFTIKSLESKIIMLKIYNSAGSLILAKPENSNEIILETPNFAKGVCIVEVTLEGNRKVIKRGVKL